MSTDRFERQRRVLTHPVTLAALATLALNDFVLRRAWPSGFTGKLGDLAWLFAAPLVVAVVIALAFDWLGRAPAGRRSPSAFDSWQACGAAGFALIGGIFALAKTIPAANVLVNATAGALFGFPVAWRRDPTDLIALLALLPAWRLWRTGRILPGRASLGQDHHPLGRPSAARYLAWLIVPLAVGLTMADSPQPRGDPGVYCLSVENGDLIARTMTGNYVSRDGGLSWDPAPTPTPEPTWTPSPAVPDSVTPGNAQLPPAAQPGGKRGLSAPLLADLDHQAALRAERKLVGVTGIASRVPTSTLTSTVEAGASRALTTTVTLTPTLSVAAAAQATLDASPMFIPHCTPKNPIADPNRPQITYRYRQEDVIERSEDGGQTWIPEYWLVTLSDSERQTYTQGHNANSYGGDNTMSVFAPRPLDAIFDPVTGNALFAMGHEGVLVRSTSGQWWWATLGRYRHLGK